MGLTPVDQMPIDNPSDPSRAIALAWGDLTQLAPQDHVDVLVVSALPGDYSPTQGSLIGALASAGVSVASLAQNKAFNFEPGMPCWISQPVGTPGPGIQFDRVLVYEPANPATDGALDAWSIFQALQCALPAQPVKVALPLVCSGSGGADPSQIVTGLFRAAAHWGSSNSFALAQTTIVAYTAQAAQQVAPTFATNRENYQNVFQLPMPGPYASFVEQAQNTIAHAQFPRTVTNRQAVAICLYTSNYYSYINNPLRFSGPGAPDYEQMYPLFEAIDSGLWNVTLLNGTSYRRQTMSADRRAQYAVGATITEKGYTSTSMTDQPQFGPDSIIFAGRTGSEVWPYSAYAQEQEVLFHRDFPFVVNTRDCPGACTFNVTDATPTWCQGG